MVVCTYPLDLNRNNVSANVTSVCTYVRVCALAAVKGGKVKVMNKAPNGSRPPFIVVIRSEKERVNLRRESQP